MTISEKEWIRENWDRALRDFTKALEENRMTTDVISTMERLKFRFVQANEDDERIAHEAGFIM